MDTLEFMTDATTIPIVLDGDTGYGNFNNMRAWCGSSNSAAWPGCASRTSSSPRPAASSAASASPSLTSKNFAASSRRARIRRTIRISPSSRGWRRSLPAGGGLVFRYEYERAVRDRFLVHYDAVAVRSDGRMHGIVLNESEQVGLVNPKTGKQQLASWRPSGSLTRPTSKRG